jgi:signal transduction histidine kinase
LVGLLQPLDLQAADRGTAAEAQALVAKAVALYKSKGVAAFKTMNAPKGGFRDRDLYVFVIAKDGTVRVHLDPKVVGTSITPLKDVDGFKFGAAMLAKATAKGVWVKYKWLNPRSGKVEAKSSWVVRQGGYVFGCGIYQR